MMKASRGNRLTSAWQCPRCRTAVDARTFRLDPRDPTQLVCPNQACAAQFAWKRQNKGKLWPEHRAYSVLR